MAISSTNSMKMLATKDRRAHCCSFRLFLELLVVHEVCSFQAYSQEHGDLAWGKC